MRILSGSFSFSRMDAITGDRGNATLHSIFKA